MSIESVTAEKHTPGPWAIKPRPPVEIRLKRPHWEVGSMATRKGIAFAFGDTEADARLIAAAPDLLAALRELLPNVVFHNRECTVFQVGGICDDEDCGGSKRRAMAQAAIDKAEGRSDG